MPRCSMRSGRVWMDCGAMPATERASGADVMPGTRFCRAAFRRHARAAAALPKRMASHVSGCPIMPFVDRVARGLRRFERRHLRRRYGDRLSSSGTASMTRGMASDGELREPRNGYRLVPYERVGGGGQHGANHPPGGSSGREGLGGDVRDALDLVHAVFPSSCGWISENGADVHLKRAAYGKATQPAARERPGRGTRAAGYDSTTDTGERARTPEPSSSRIQMDSTWDDMERSGDGRPRVERKRWRDSVVVSSTPSNLGDG